MNDIDKEEEYLLVLCSNSDQVSIAEIKFIDSSFKANGKGKKSSFGDYSAGLFRLKDEAFIQISKLDNGNFQVDLNAKNGYWEFSVEVEKGSGKWINPTQFEDVSVEPPFED